MWIDITDKKNQIYYKQNKRTMKNDKKNENEIMDCILSGLMGLAFAMYIIFMI